MKIIKKSLIGFAFLGVLSTVASASAAGVILTNGGFSQASDAGSFGVSVCNGGNSAFSGTVPVLISTNGVSKTVSFSSPLAAGACASTNLAYSTFNMTAGNSYIVQATIDPNFTVISNDNDRITSGSITVPGGATNVTTGPLLATAQANTTGGQVLGASTMSASERNLLLGELASAEAALNALLAQAAGK